MNFVEICKVCVRNIGGFRDTYLGRQVVSRPGGPRAGMGSAGSLGALRAPLAGFGAEPQPKSNLLPFIPKISHQVATISIIFNAMQTTNFKVKNIWGGNASPASPLNPLMVRKAIIIAAKRIINSDKICSSHSDLNFGVIFGTQCIAIYHKLLWKLYQLWTAWQILFSLVLIS